MSKTEAMSIDERRKYIHKMWGRYRTSKKKEKGKLLDEIEAVTGMHRKAFLRLLNGRLSRKKRRRERGRVYGVEVSNAVLVIARSLDYPCAERLQPNLVWRAHHIHRHGELNVGKESLEKLARISISTLKRIYQQRRCSEIKLAFTQPRRTPTNNLRRQYPMQKIAWDIPEAGHFEVDLVHHCGENANEEYIHSIQMVDIATGWSEMVAVYGRSYRVMADGFEYMLARLPFAVQEIHPDNGGEFFNRHLLRYWKEKVPDLQLSRSHPYQKNDNRFVEENNHSLIRTYIGHDRLGTQAQLKALRQLYEKLWLYHNFFQPVMRLQEKEYVSSLQYRRKYDRAKTPFDRLKEKNILNENTRQQLETQREQINPMILRNQIDEMISHLLSLPALNHSETVNVFETLIKEAHASVTLSFEPTTPFRLHYLLT